MSKNWLFHNLIFIFIIYNEKKLSVNVKFMIIS